MKNHKPWMMIICIIPMLLLFVFLSRSSGESSSWYLFLLPLLCVGSHYFLMKNHDCGSKDSTGEADTVTTGHSENKLKNHKETRLP